jgi:hypothetical protein
MLDPAEAAAVASTVADRTKDPLADGGINPPELLVWRPAEAELFCIE